jgi:EamA domain-containing membrane protein RarD
LITVILARFALRERLNRVQMIGILLALVSAGLLAM